MANLRLQLDLTMSPLFLKSVFVGALLALLAPELGSENVTLTTYYPAPSGVYAKMITTDNTFLARDGGAASKVGIGTALPLSKLSVNGGTALGAYSTANAAPATGLIVSGFVGVGTPAPSVQLEVTPSNPANVAFQVNGTAVFTRNLQLNGGGCSLNTINANGITPVCAGANYATFMPGLYMNNFTAYDDRGGFAVTQIGAGTTITINNNVNYYCCPRI
mgnify:CR=1 FL=1